MKVCGIISEYNPFHNGHKFHIEETRKRGATHIVAVMSGNVVQRGDISMLDKHYRAKKACENGADLVLELPCPYSCGSAERFSQGALAVLAGLGGVVEQLSFGSETDDIDLLVKSAESLEQLKNSQRVKELVALGNSYPSAVSVACKEKFGEKISKVISSPNNTLAIEYIKAIREQGLLISPMCIKRKGVSHDSIETTHDIASASFIRQQAYDNKSFGGFLPYDISTQNFFDINIMTKAVVFKFKSLSLEQLMEIPDCNKEIALRIFDYLRKETPVSLNEFYDNIKTKNITHARIRRVILYGILDISAEDFNLKPYGRILAVNSKGTEILAKLKDRETMPVSHSLAKLSKQGRDFERLAQMDVVTSEFQKLCTHENVEFPNEYSVKFEKTK